MRSLAIASILLIAGCAGTVPSGVAATQPTSIAWSKDIAHATRFWRDEGDARWGKGQTFVFVAHGGDDPKTGRWTCRNDDGHRYDVETIARVLSEEHSAQHILLIVCNSSHHKLDIPRHNVWYPRNVVWSIPHCLFCDDDAVDSLDGFDH